MSTVSHVDLTSNQIHTPFRWVQEGDPGGGTGHAGHVWVKLSTAEIRRRKDDDSGWDLIGGAGASSLSGTIFNSLGDILIGTANDTPGIRTVGADGRFLRAHSADPTGLDWYDHEGAADPHPTYTTAAEAGTIADTEAAAAVSTHAGAADPHPVYTTNAEATTIADAEAAAAVSTHAGLADPHPGYTTAAELATALAAYILKGEFLAKGDLLVATGAGTFAVLPVGTDGQALTADSSAAVGMSWQTVPSSLLPIPPEPLAMELLGGFEL